MTASGKSAAHVSGFAPTWLYFLIAFCCGLVAVAPNVSAQGGGKPSEYEVEAAYLSNFGRFVGWPARPAAGEFEVCVLGQDPFGTLLDAALKGETIGGAPMVAKRIAGVTEAAGCRIVFVNPAKETKLKAVLDGLNSNVLTVSDSPGFTRQGGMIQFVLEDNRVRFEINLAAAQRAGLTLSSELLKVAVAIRRTP
jgi:hypothetical protein